MNVRRTFAGGMRSVLISKEVMTVGARWDIRLEIRLSNVSNHPKILWTVGGVSVSVESGRIAL